MENKLTFSKEIITNGRIILVDEPLSTKTRLGLEKLTTIDEKELIFLDGSQLAIDLEEIIKEIVKNERNILFVFPGNGSNYPRKLSQIYTDYSYVGVKAKRIWQPGTDPVVFVDIIMPEMFLITDVKTIIVVDDVISSGLTLRKLYQKNSWRFTQAKWIGTSWLCQNLQNGIKGYDHLETACIVKKTSLGKVPINSLSTLRNNLEIATSYARRHLKEPELFLKFLKE